MARYIDTDLIKTVVYPPIPKEEETDSEYFYRCGWQDGIGKVLELPTADVAERKKGEWIKFDEGNTVCSLCGYELEDWTQGIFYNYCPNCGADMRGENK